VRRHTVLIPLSQDHHRDLIHAQRMRRAAKDAPSGASLPPERSSPSSAHTWLTTFAAKGKPSSRYRRGGRRKSRTARTGLARPPTAARVRSSARRRAHRGQFAAAEPDRLSARVTHPARRAPALSTHRAARERPARPHHPQHRSRNRPLSILALARVKGPLWGKASDDLNVTMLAWGRGSVTPEHVNGERDVLIVCLAGAGTVRAHRLAAGKPHLRLRRGTDTH
jgi:hypothetical protein